MARRRILLIALVALATFALDRVTKSAIVAAIPLGEAREVVGDYVRLTHVRNTGAAFGLLPERTTLLSILSVVAVAAILYYYRRLAGQSPAIAATLGMQLGGALGNLFDRVGQGYVVDFVDVGVGPVRFWAFNVADSAIVVGIGVVIVLLWWQERRTGMGPRGSPA
ncbi:MAG: signal peptidase II [Candidatus Limnocylindria bacterium]